MTDPDLKPALDDVSAYDYVLPEALIAHRPAPERAASRLMVCRGVEREVVAFSDLLRFVGPGDLLVFNDTRVVPCRLAATRARTGGKVEVFVLGPLIEGDWTSRGEVRARALTKSNKSLRAGEVLALTLEGVRAQLIGRLEDGTWELRFEGASDLLSLVEAAGQVPLPPYIVGRRKALGEPLAQEQDTDRYQTVYARNPGAVAAPTAGLHFSEPLMARLRDKGVELGFLTLHVGIGTFRPLREGSISAQSLHEETYLIDEALAAQVARVAEAGGRIIAVGTTAARALEDQGRRHGARRVVPGTFKTDIFIRPGFDWRLVDGMVTNFHLPRSSLLVLISALAGHDRVMAAYEEAIERRMRFYSYGDAMLLFGEGGG